MGRELEEVEKRRQVFFRALRKAGDLDRLSALMDESHGTLMAYGAGTPIPDDAYIKLEAISVRPAPDRYV